MMFRLMDCMVWSIECELCKLKSYRRHKGGTWYRVFPKPYPYMSYWTDRKLSNEVELEIEIYYMK